MPRLLLFLPFRPRTGLVVATLAGLAAMSGARAEKLVVIRSTADDAYLKSRWVDGVRRKETYVFTRGSFIPGESYDRSLERASFESMVRVLATDLQKQDYLPAPSIASADLLLVVHWGATARVEQNYDLEARSFDTVRELGEAYAEQKQFEETEATQNNNFLPAAASGLGGIEQQIDHEISSLQQNQIAADFGGDSTARLLGFSQALNREQTTLIYSDHYRALYEMTKEERYFILVMAYDFPLLRTKGRLKRHWVVRASIRSAGVNFRQAVDRISVVAGNYFGQRHDEIVFDRKTDRTGRVEIGEVTVLGTAAPTSPRKSP
jgi:hypothetical protein